MMAMMQQMLRGMDPNADPNAPPPEMPPGMESFSKLFAAMNGGQGMGGMGQDAQEAEPAPSSAYIWRIVHALFSLTLAVYIASATSFTGSKASRTKPPFSAEEEADIGKRLFWIFATVEVVLQSSRYFLEKGRLVSQGGLLGWLSALLPEPWAGYARIVGRYSVIYGTVVADAMVVVFVLGAVSWWNSGKEDVVYGHDYL
jgi:GET complex subunit GET2